MVQTYRDPWIRKAKWLTQALIISATLNVGLLSTFIYSALTDEKTPKALDVTSAKHRSQENIGLDALIEKYSGLSFQDLLVRLSNTNHVESGYTRRDIALGCLVTFHYFNLERALGGVSLQKRAITFDHNKTLYVFPGLADYQYQAVVHYAKTEKWPHTSEGLFVELQKQRPPYDPSLAEAFYLSPEFHFISMLFAKTGINIKKEHIIALLAQSEWSTIEETSQHLQTNAAFTIEERRHLLLQLIGQNATIAGKILLESDQEYCLKHLDNTQVLHLCNLLEDRTSPSFLKELLKNPRADEVWEKAASLLYVQAAEEVPEKLELEIAKRRFIDLKTSPARAPITTAGPVDQASTYTVVSGDSLWKIANTHHTTVQALREANNMKSDTLRIGQKLKLP